ncbi:hypothetical protein COLO4_36640 [Corchorus olitorius]|uniref:Uncharacterized protein n=1 Tax=Corchorus olitorius TaxID=93759 RepID=A0A1R3G764_9ROSI|nr:hypothetical protein COLO4_36640 [Corchorus olitorius]
MSGVRFYSEERERCVVCIFQVHSPNLFHVHVWRSGGLSWQGSHLPYHMIILSFDVHTCNT